MQASTPISIAKLPDKTFVFSLNPFDSRITGDIIAYPCVTHEQLEILREGIPERVQKVLASLTNL